MIVEESSVRFFLLVIGILIILYILWDGLRQQKKTQQPKEAFSKHSNPSSEQEFLEEGIIGEVRIIPNPDPPVLPEKVPGQLRPSTLKYAPPKLKSFQAYEERIAFMQKSALKEGKFLLLNILAKPGSYFEGYKLFQIVLAHGFQFGARNFFHRHVSLDPRSKILFSLSSSVAPGTFDPTKMADFRCVGLVLFMNMEQHERPEEVFDMMLKTAKSLAESLQGELIQDDGAIAS